MPTYEYKCNSCEHTFEKFQSMSTPNPTKCPECGAGTITKLFSTGSGLIFKGSGFYQTDYKSLGKTAKKNPLSKTETKTETAASAHTCGGSCAHKNLGD